MPPAGCGSLPQSSGNAGVPRGLAAHAVLTVGWTAVLSVALRRPPRVARGAAAGALIAALDLGLVGRRFPAIEALPTFPQVADHLAFGALVGATLDRREPNGGDGR